MSPSVASDCANAAPPEAMMSLPGSRISSAISSARSPRAILESGQSARSSVLANTTFGMSFIGAA